MGQHLFITFHGRRRRQDFTRRQVMAYLRENPGIALSAAADHDGTAAGLFHQGCRRRAVDDVAVADDRDGYGIDDGFDFLPVRLAAIELFPRPSVDGDGSAPVVEMDNFMFTEMGDNVIVYGSNAQAFDAALWLTVHKKNVTIVTPNPASEFDMQQSQHAMRMMTTALYALGVKSYPQSAIKTVSGNVATLTLDSGVEMNIKCDAIVNGADMLPNTSLVDGIDCKEVYTIGDCANPFNIALAIRGGNDAGRAV